jgi:hypothetical protein
MSGTMLNKGHITDKEENWEELYTELLPGAHLLMISNPSDYHKNATAIEKADFEIRDMLSYFCKDCFYLIVMARKPFELKLSEKTNKPTKSTITAVENVIKHGVGAINIDACRVPTDDVLVSGGTVEEATSDNTVSFNRAEKFKQNPEGRWPANVIHDGSEEVLNSFPETQAPKQNSKGTGLGGEVYNGGDGQTFEQKQFADQGSAARYFYTANTKENLITYLQTMIGLTE